MSKMSGNPHYGAATNHQDQAEAAIDATLALAFEQRTASLIALYADGTAGAAPGIDYEALLVQITQRLGL